MTNLILVIGESDFFDFSSCFVGFEYSPERAKEDREKRDRIHDCGNVQRDAKNRRSHNAYLKRHFSSVSFRSCFSTFRIMVLLGSAYGMSLWLQEYNVANVEVGFGIHFGPKAQVLLSAPCFKSCTPVLDHGFVARALGPKPKQNPNFKFRPCPFFIYLFF